MTDKIKPNVAIVDYGMGNLFSIQQASWAAGLDGQITSLWKDLLIADAVILPGVGTFGAAMERLKALDMLSVLRDIVEEDKPLMGICLGMQLLMTGSYEFGYHAGLNVFDGPVVRLDNPIEGEKKLKVPHIGWNKIVSYSGQGSKQNRVSNSLERENYFKEKLCCEHDGKDAVNDSTDFKDKYPKWHGSPLESVQDEECMYFVHSYYVKPEDADVVLAETKYGHIKFCSALQRGNVFACQFHPERSGSAGLKIYHNLALALIRKNKFNHKSLSGDIL